RPPHTPQNIRTPIAPPRRPRPPVRITNHDNGPGIDPGEAERVFEPFFTRRRKGTGLGLSITRRILEAHRGSIKIAPHPEGGTAVTLEIPIEGEESG
ncbi:MAG: PAS domain-containing sensor histidine kinase, partial [Candidatus Sumerlaeia bacterium]|nr:PAS domain-containing sensor histidine kinase [Candidatus Sumerlaeia bacterium]